MPNWVSLSVLNELRFAMDPVRMSKLRRWCRNEKLPSRKIDGEWLVDLDEFDAMKTTRLDPFAAAVAALLN